MTGRTDFARLRENCNRRALGSAYRLDQYLTNMVKVFGHNKSLLPRTTGLCALKIDCHSEFGFEGPNLRHRKVSL